MPKGLQGFQKGVYVGPKWTKEKRKIQSQRILEQYENDSRIGFKKGNIPKYKFSKDNPFRFKKGGIPWNKGKKGVQSFEYMVGEKHYKWKGDKAGYGSIHDWVKRQLGKPQKCEFCGQIESIEHRLNWANKTGKYLRDINDWLRLCLKCHRKYDKQQKQTAFSWRVGFIRNKLGSTS